MMRKLVLFVVLSLLASAAHAGCPPEVLPHADFWMTGPSSVHVGETFEVQIHVSASAQDSALTVWAHIADIEAIGIDILSVQPGGGNDRFTITQNLDLPACFYDDRVRFITVDWMDGFSSTHVATLECVAMVAGDALVDWTPQPINTFGCSGNFMAHRTNATLGDWCGGWEIRDGDPGTGTTTRAGVFLRADPARTLPVRASTWSTIKGMYR